MPRGTATKKKKRKNVAKSYEQMDSLMMKGSENPDLKDIIAAELKAPKAVIYTKYVTKRSY